MVIGDPAMWAARFRSLDVRFLRRVIAVWPECVAMLPHQPVEDAITINLVNILSKDPQARRLFYWLEFQYEPFGFTPVGTAFSRGKIDMALFLDRDRERYLAYECKRLNVVHNGRRSSLATLYVTEGLIRFVTEQYAENLSVGCMLGYVLDGNVSEAQRRIHVAIDDRQSDIGLIAGPSPDQSIGSVKRFLSRHRRSVTGQEIEIRHALLPFPQSVRGRGNEPLR